MSDFTPTAGQAMALEAIRSMPKLFPGGGGVAVISGYAGTGKTTLLKVLYAETPDTFVLTPTGKAAVRVREAAGCDAMTIHKWMYNPKKDGETGEYTFDQKDKKDLKVPPNKTLIVDEASMIGATVFKHLHWFCSQLGLNIVLIGDGFQLPPVERESQESGFSVFNSNFKADIRVNLTEVLRQALESPIIRISTDLRTKTDIMSAVAALPVVLTSGLDQAMIANGEAGGVIVCHKNQTRHDLNVRLRKLRGLPDGVLVEDEPLLVVKNNYELDVFNGEVFTVKELGKKHPSEAVKDRYKNKSMYMSFQELVLKENERGAVVAVQEVFGKADGMNPDAIKKGSASAMKKAYGGKVKEDRPQHMHANLGYAMTCHKSQGSEWPEALIFIDDSIRLGTTEGRRWAYTALTRAKNKVSVYWP